MKFQDLVDLMEKEFEIDFQADIARELDVTPQTLNNWKIRNKVPFKYVKKINKKIDKKKSLQFESIKNPGYYGNPMTQKDEDELDVIKLLLAVAIDVKNNFAYFLVILIMFLFYAVINHKYFSIPKFASNATIMSAQNSDNISSSLTSVTQSFGLSMPGANMSISDPQMIKELLFSKKIALKILNEKFDSKVHGKNKKLINILSYKNDLSDQKLTRDDTTNIVVTFTEQNIKLIKTHNPAIVRFNTFFTSQKLHH